MPFPPPGDLPDPGIESRSPALQAGSLPSEPPGKPNAVDLVFLKNELFFFATPHSLWDLSFPNRD